MMAKKVERPGGHYYASAPLPKDAREKLEKRAADEKAKNDK